MIYDFWPVVSVKKISKEVAKITQDYQLFQGYQKIHNPWNIP